MTRLPEPRWARLPPARRLLERRPLERRPLEPVRQQLERRQLERQLLERQLLERQLLDRRPPLRQLLSVPRRLMQPHSKGKL